MALKCFHCNDELEGDDRDNPLHDSDGNAYCERCYRDEIEGMCDRCWDYFEQDKELAMRPGELLALWEETDGLKAGYYLVLSWPIYMDGMITGSIVKESLAFFAELDAEGIESAKAANSPGGRLCRECREEIAMTQVKETNGKGHGTPAQPTKS